MWFNISVFILVLIVIMSYSGAVNNSFVSWDDDAYVVNNQLVRQEEGVGLKEVFTTVVSSNYHPLTMLSLRWNRNSCSDCQGGISPKPFITTNILLHALNTILVLVLIWFLFGRDLLLAFVVAALFAVHPMHVESVAWISGRKDLLSSFFLLSGLVAWFHYVTGSSRKYTWYALAFGLFILACLSKATAVVFPLLALLIRYLTLERKQVDVKKDLAETFSPNILVALLPFLLVSLLFGTLAFKLQHGENFMGLLKFAREPESVINVVGPFSLMQRCQIACNGFFVYLGKFIVPVNQSAFYPYPADHGINQAVFRAMLWLSLPGFLFTWLLVILSMKRTKLFVFSLGFFLITLMLVLQFISVGKAIVAERYTYIPYIGISILPAWFISHSRGRWRNSILAMSGLILVVLVILARKQAEVWHDTEKLWSQVIQNQPDEELAWRARGKYYFGQLAKVTDVSERKKLENKALADFRTAIEHNTGSADVYMGMGVILQSRGEFNTALQYLNKAISMNPSIGRSYYNRAVVLDQMNRKEDAIRDYDTALDKDPAEALEIFRNRSALCLETGKFEKALRDLNALIRLEPTNYMDYFNRAYAKVMLKDYTGAIEDYYTVLKYHPGDAKAIEYIRALSAQAKNNH